MERQNILEDPYYLHAKRMLENIRMKIEKREEIFDRDFPKKQRFRIKNYFKRDYKGLRTTRYLSRVAKRG